MRALVALAAALLLAASPQAAASTCPLEMGPGWPAATGNYGEGTVNLLGGNHQAGISWLSLPRRGVESQLVLAPDEQGQWWVTSARADRRIHHTSNSRTNYGVELRLDQEPEIDRAPIPAELATRLIAHWQRALSLAQMAERAPVMGEEDIFSLQLDGQRFSGRTPECSLLVRLLDQRSLLEELATSKEKKHEKRYEAIGRALDKYDERIADGKA